MHQSEFLKAMALYCCLVALTFSDITLGENENNVVNMEVQKESNNVKTDIHNHQADQSGNKEEADRLATLAREQERRLGEVDWGQADGDNGWDERAKQNIVHSEGTNHQDLGVVNPEHVLHDESHRDAHTEGDTDPAQAIEMAIKDGKEKEEAEKKALDSLRPEVLKNVHDGPSRTVAEFMKNQQFGPGDLDEVMHGGHHVHDSDQQTGQVQGGDVEKIVHGEEGIHDDHHQKEKNASTLDPDQLLHGSEEGVHNHKSETDEMMPGGMPPKDPLLSQRLKKDHNVTVEKKPMGVDPERELHGDDHVHEDDHDPNYKPKNKVTYQDIIDLGLSEEQLKGIDLTKLLKQEQEEFSNWQKESGDSNYWQDVKDLRKEYLQKIYSKIKHLSPSQDENQEWEFSEDDIVHRGENRLEHEMEMWGRTEPKAQRQSYEAIYGQKRDEGEKQAEELNEKEPNDL